MPPITVKILDASLKKFISKLQKPTIAKTLHVINLLKQFGSHLSFPHTQKINQDLHELRIKGQQEVRIFYTIISNQIILIHGFIKKSNKTPKKEVDTATKKIKALIDTV